MRLVTLKEFIDRAKVRHGDKYEYSKVSFKKCTESVTIICPTHGEFVQKVGDHLAGCGCRQCKYENHKGKVGVSKEDFLARAFDRHGDSYDYSDIEYVGFEVKVRIVCRVHGTFLQTPRNHVKHGCPECGLVRRAKSKTLSQEEVVSRFRVTHGETYNYSKVNYVSSRTPVTIICKKHGEFKQTVFSHMNGNGCPKCANIYTAAKKTYTFADFLEKARSRHGDKYIYDKAEGDFSSGEILITCPTHGDFVQVRAHHLAGNGCPSCSVRESKPEQALLEMLLPYFPDSQRRVKSVIHPKELDIFIPSKNFAIEYNGLVFHSTHPTFAENPINRHKDKTDACRSKGIHLFHLYEDDWLNRPETVKHTLKHLLGVTDKTVYARKTTLKQHNLSEVKEFYNKYHMQGSPYQGSLIYSLYDGEEMVACMTFSKPSSERGNTDSGRYELLRYACKYSVVGGASKLFKHFITEHKPTSVVSYSDDSMFSGKMYEVLGFKQTGKVKPDYKVIVGKERKHKSGFRRSNLEKLLGDKFDPNLSERENCHNNGLYRIYNAGLTKWEYT